MFDNVRSKWLQVLRRPARLGQLFSGYHAPQALVHTVLNRVGVKVEDLAAEGAGLKQGLVLGGVKVVGGGKQGPGGTLGEWGEWELHRLVAHFLAARFPFLLALNKSDLPAAAGNIERVLQAYPHDAAVAVSAAAEVQLCQWRRAGVVGYLHGAATAAATAPTAATAAAATAATTAATAAGDGGCFSSAAVADGLHGEEVAVSHHVEVAAAADAMTQEAAAAVAVAEKLPGICSRVLQPLGGTGALLALTTAMALKPPRWVYPIGDKQTCAALPARSAHSGSAGGLGGGVDAKARAAEGALAGVLRDCVLLKPGSTVEDVFAVLKWPPYLLLEGEFVRAEARVLKGLPEAAVAAIAGACRQEQQQVEVAQESAAYRTARAVAAAAQEAAAAAWGGSGLSSHAFRVVKKDELVGPDNCVLLLQTNRKAAWQAAAGATAAGGRHAPSKH